MIGAVDMHCNAMCALSFHVYQYFDSNSVFDFC